MAGGRGDPVRTKAGGPPGEPPARESRPSGGRPGAYHFTWVRRPKMSNSVSSPPVSTEAEM